MMPPPRRAQSVVLRLPDADAELPARVDAVADDVVTLVLSQPPDRGDALHDLHAVVEYTTPRGVHRLSGALARTGEAPEVVEVHRDGDDEVVQRRDYVRVDAVMPVRLTISDPLRGKAHTTTLNISGGGLLFLDPLDLPADAVIDVEVEVAPGAPPVRARGRIVREVGRDAKGVQIESIAAEDRERLIRYVTERERLALRIARGQ